MPAAVHGLGPGSRVAQPFERVQDGDVTGRHVVDVVPRHRERHGHAHPQPGLWADTTVDPAPRAESTKTLPPGRPFTNAVVAMDGSRRSTGAARARVACGGEAVDRRHRTKTCSPFGPFVFTAPARADPASRTAH